MQVDGCNDFFFLRVQVLLYHTRIYVFPAGQNAMHLVWFPNILGDNLSFMGTILSKEITPMLPSLLDSDTAVNLSTISFVSFRLVTLWKDLENWPSSDLSSVDSFELLTLRTAEYCNGHKK